MSAPLRSLRPATEKPDTYMNSPIIRDAVNILDTDHNESDVERAISLIFGRIFPQDKGWSNVPQYLVPEIKRPDRLVEKYTESGDLRANFLPHIFVELKSAKGDSLEKAVNQSTSSMPESVDKLGGSFSMFLIIVKGKYIAFFEYHNDRSNLYEDGVLNTKGAIPFNLAQIFASDHKGLDERPYYKGSGTLLEDNEDGDTGPEVMEGIFLPLDLEDVKVEKVLTWMKEHDPLKVSKASTVPVGVPPSVPFDSARFPASMDIDE